MAGKRQHYIPQFILKQFAVPGTQPERLFLYRRGSTPRSVGTRDLAVQEHFYSRPEIGIDYSLDDKITDYETSTLLREHKELLESPEGTIDPEVASSFTVHLSVRTRALRDAFKTAISRFATDFRGAVNSPEWLLAQMGKPNDPESQLSQLIDEQFRKLGLDKLPRHKRDQMKRLLGTSVRQLTVTRHAEITAEMESGLGFLETGSGDAIAKKHRDILAQVLTPEQRKNVLQQLTWERRSHGDSKLILSDVVAVAKQGNEPSQPYMFAGSNFDVVYVPITQTSVLVGSRAETPQVDSAQLNRMSAAASLSSFFASEATKPLIEIAEVIGSNFTRVLDQVSEESGLFKKSLG